MPVICWVCGEEIRDDEARVLPRKVPRPLRCHEEQPIHLRCQGDWGSVRRKAVPDAAPACAHRGCKKTLKHSAVVERTFLFTEDIAEMRGTTVQQARRWLTELEAQYGTAVVGHVVGRRGPRRYTTAAALATIGPRLVEKSNTTACDASTLKQLTRTIEKISQRLSAVEAELAGRIGT